MIHALQMEPAGPVENLSFWSHSLYSDTASAAPSTRAEPSPCDEDVRPTRLQRAQVGRETPTGIACVNFRTRRMRATGHSLQLNNSLTNVVAAYRSRLL